MQRYCESLRIPTSYVSQIPKTFDVDKMICTLLSVQSGPIARYVNIDENQIKCLNSFLTFILYDFL